METYEAPSCEVEIITLANTVLSNEDYSEKPVDPEFYD